MCLFHFHMAIRRLWPQSWLLNLTWLDTYLHPSLSYTSSSIFLQLYLKSTVYISFSRSFLGHSLLLWPCAAHGIFAWLCCNMFPLFLKRKLSCAQITCCDCVDAFAVYSSGPSRWHNWRAVWHQQRISRLYIFQPCKGLLQSWNEIYCKPCIFREHEIFDDFRELRKIAKLSIRKFF